jgi:hypothetical protein
MMRLRNTEFKFGFEKAYNLQYKGQVELFNLKKSGSWKNLVTLLREAKSSNKNMNILN